MSNSSIQVNGNDSVFVNRDLSKIFIWENRYHKESYNNGNYFTVTIPQGTLMGRVAASGYVIPCASTASDGSQIPIGILADDITVLSGATNDVQICIYGDVVEGKVICAVGDTLDSTVSSRSQRLRDLVTAAGIRLVISTEMTDFDNS